jgi:hypothetical protein
MVKIEYQLTFDEFNEGMKLAQRRFAAKVRRQGRKRPALLVVFGVLLGGVASYMLLARTVWPAATRAWRSDPVSVAARRFSTTTLERIEPHLFWFGLMVLFVVLLMWRIRAQVAQHRRNLWDGVPAVQQARVVTFDDEGVSEDHALARAFKRWAYVNRAEETPALFILFSSDYSLEIFPKRAFTDSAANEYRALVQSRIQPQTRAFPVISVEPVNAP